MNYVKAKYLVTFKTGKLDSNAAEEGGLYPFFTCSQITSLKGMLSVF
jgi:type I restriction enzyme S subunit